MPSDYTRKETQGQNTRALHLSFKRMNTLVRQRSSYLKKDHTGWTHWVVLVWFGLRVSSNNSWPQKYTFQPYKNTRTQHYVHSKFKYNDQQHIPKSCIPCPHHHFPEYSQQIELEDGSSITTSWLTLQNSNRILFNSMEGIIVYLYFL